MPIRADSLGSRCLWLGLALGGLWLASLLPAQAYFGSAGIEALSISAATCLAAGCLVFWVVSRKASPRTQAFAVLLGTLVRGALALVAVGAMQFVLKLSASNYLIWLSLFYLASLAIETALLVRPAVEPRDRGQAS
jgi:hypothetical protein